MCARFQSKAHIFNSIFPPYLALIFFFFFFFLVFRKRVFFYSPGCPGPHFLNQAGLELRNPAASASGVLGLKSCATTPSLAPHSFQHVHFFEFLMLAIPVGVRWTLIVLIWTSLMKKDFEHFFKYSLATHNSSVESSLISTVPHTVIGIFGLLVSNPLSSLEIWILSLCQMKDYWRLCSSV